MSPPPRITAMVAAWDPAFVNNLGVLIVLNLVERLCVATATDVDTTALCVYIFTDISGISLMVSTYMDIRIYYY